MIYSYQTPVGTFQIRPHRFHETKAELWVETQSLGTFPDERAAAAQVQAHDTGFAFWDRDLSLETPSDLSDWQTQ